MEWLLLTETLRMDLVIRTTLFTGRVSISPWPRGPSVPTRPVPGSVCSSATCQQAVRPAARRAVGAIRCYPIKLCSDIP